MHTAEAKRILETALIGAQQPLQMRDLRALFEDEVGADTIRDMLLALWPRACAARHCMLVSWCWSIRSRDCE